MLKFRHLIIVYPAAFASRWTYNFSRSCDETFNLEAMDIFADDFLRRIEDRWYAESNPTPDWFKDLSYIKQCFKVQLRYRIARRKGEVNLSLVRAEDV
jgi:hypothetical protein